VRINRNGSASRESFQLNLGQGASNKANPPLRDGDTVVVNRNLLASTADAVNAVTTPLTGLASVLSLIQLINNSRR